MVLLHGCMHTRAAPLSHPSLGWVGPHHYQHTTAELEPVCLVLPGGLNRLSPRSQSDISRLSSWHQYLQRKDFTVVVQPFFQNTFVPLNEVSGGHFWEAHVQSRTLGTSFSTPAVFRPSCFTRAPKGLLFLLFLFPAALFWSVIRTWRDWERGNKH